MHFSGARQSGLSLAVALLGGLARPASAAEIVTVDASELELRAGPSSTLRLRPETPPMRRGIPALTEQTVDDHRLAEVRLPVRGSGRAEMWVADVGVKPPRLLWKGFSGPRDSDDEVSVMVQLTGDGLIEYQTAASISRCDGQPARLFPRAWDFSSGRFRPVLSPLPAPASRTLIARRDDPAAPSGRPAGGFQWVAASTTATEGRDARGLTAPVALNDGNPTTTWAEGLGGDGRGEFLTARAAAGPLLVTGLRIVPGDGSSAAAFRARNRLRRFQLALGPNAEQKFDVELPTDPATGGGAAWNRPFWVALPQPLPSSCVTIVLTEVYRGSEAAPPKTFGTTAIADLDVFTDLDQPGGVDRLVAAMADGNDCAARVPLLVGLGEPALALTVRALPSATGAARSCLLDALTRLAPAPNTEPVVNALLAALREATPAEEAAIQRALLAAQPPPIAALERYLTGKSNSDNNDGSDGAGGVDSRARAARLLGAFDSPAAAATLLAGAGRGPDEVRAAVVQALSVSPALTPEALWTTLALNRSGPLGDQTLDLLRVLPLYWGRHPEAAASALPALRGALGPERPFEVRGRVVMAIGSLRTADGATALAELRAFDSDPTVRFLAARELAGDPGAVAGTALRAALADGDPRVRETAAAALGQRGDRTASGGLVAGAKQEPWPAVRRAELDALGHLCTPDGNELMIRAVARDQAEVRRVSLIGLARCREPRAAALLLNTLNRADETATTRELAATLLGDHGDAQLAPALALALRHLVAESEADLALEAPAVAALRALGRLGGADAVTAAANLADDRRHPFQPAAIEALGGLCDPRSGAASLHRLATGDDAYLAALAEAAEKRCAAR
jgi:HEAT repeat protein